jgi:hypothetical protein
MEIEVFMTLEIGLLIGAVALALVLLNVGLQRLARPDRGSDTIAGCCGMALPEELLQTGPITEEDHEQ